MSVGDLPNEMLLAIMKACDSAGAASFAATCKQIQAIKDEEDFRKLGGNNVVRLISQWNAAIFKIIEGLEDLSTRLDGFKKGGPVSGPMAKKASIEVKKLLAAVKTIKADPAYKKLEGIISRGGGNPGIAKELSMVGVRLKVLPKRLAEVNAKISALAG